MDFQIAVLCFNYVVSVVSFTNRYLFKKRRYVLLFILSQRSSIMGKKALIIGAGPAGLTAAYELLKHSDIHPVILECSGDIGGISKTVSYHGNRIDIGGHRFFTKDEKVNALWQEIMPLQSKPSIDDLTLGIEKDLPKEGPDPEKTDDVMLLRRRVSRIYFNKHFFDYPISMKFATFRNMGFCNTMKAGFGYLGSCVHKRKETNLENFYINRFGKSLYQMFFEDYTEKVWGVHPRNISASWGTQRVKGLSLFKTLLNALTKPFKHGNKHTETSLIEQFYYPKKGPGQLYEEMAKKVVALGGEIVMNAEVTKVILDKDNKVAKLIVNHNGVDEEFTGDYVISSMAIKDLAMALGEDKTGKEVYDIATNLPYRDFITVGLLLDKLKIHNTTKIKTLNNLVPDNWIYVQDRGVKMGRIQIFNNWSPYMVADPMHKVWIGLEYFCNEGDEMWKSSDEVFIKKAVDELVSIGVIDSPADVLDSAKFRIKKAYPAYFGTYDKFDEVKDYLNTIPNLYCVGRNGQHRYNNMDHSMASAMEAVDIIINNNPDHSKIWSVNTDQSYNEEKKQK